MKKTEKLTVIASAIAGKEMCSCNFSYDDDVLYYYPNAVNEKLLLGQEVRDFCLDGYTVRKMSQLKKVEINVDKYSEINRFIGLTNQIKMPEADIASWQTVFASLKRIDTFVIIENETDGGFYIGEVIKVLKNKVLFKYFDAEGIWEEPIEILYSTITSVSWNTCYSNTWKKYFDSVSNI
ncbi:MAG: hypothetical protein IJB49_08385 [Clostridia bacterium]|nr:hypothetical protein [Clostridia bacterium]